MREAPLDPPDVDYPDDNDRDLDAENTAEWRREDEDKARRKGTW